MKNLIIGIVVVVVVALAGYYFLKGDEAALPGDQEASVVASDETAATADAEGSEAEAGMEAGADSAESVQ